MVFTLLIAADLHGTKTNFEVEFPSVPTIPELQRKVDAIFGPEHAARRPPGVPSFPFAIDRMQIFDERVELWVDLLSSSQLQDFSQIYVFQPESAWHKEVQSKLPPATRAPLHSSMVSAPVAPPSPAHRSPHHSPIRGRSPAHDLAAALNRASASPLGTRAPIRASGDCSHEEKVASVFDEMDLSKTRAITLNDFRNTLSRFLIDFSMSTVSDLFQKADANQDTVISFAEFQRFAERYPTLIGALHFRSREYWLDVRQKEGIEAARRLLDSLRAREADARAATAQAAAETAAQEGRLAAQVQAVAEAEAREREAMAILEAARAETERSRAEVAARVADLTAAREAERARQIAHADAQREVDAAEARLRAQDQETLAAEERLREIERLLMDQQREVELQRANSARARADLATAQGAEHQAGLAAAEAARDVQMAAERLALAEGDLARAQEREHDCTTAHLVSREATAQQRMQREHEEHELIVCKDREAQKRLIEAEAARAVEAQDAMAKALEAENIEHNMVRHRVQEEEAPLLEQEVRLREQRDNLEEKEAMLRNETGAFSARTTGRGSLSASPRAVHAAAAAAAIASPRTDIRSSSPRRSPYTATPVRTIEGSLSPRVYDSIRKPSVSPRRYGPSSPL